MINYAGGRTAELGPEPPNIVAEGYAGPITEGLANFNNVKTYDAVL